MNSAADMNWERIIILMGDILNHKNPTKIMLEVEANYPQIAPLFDELKKLREFSHSLANGDLHQSLDIRGYFAGSLKSLQSNLRHLTWQAGMVANGDYSQRVDFMGDFSAAFNSMTQKLKEAADQERKYRLLAENTADVIWLLDHEMKLQYISPSIEKLLGYVQSELEGRSLSNLPLPFIHAAFPRGDLGELFSDIQFLPKTVELQLPDHNGKLIWTETFITITSEPSDNQLLFLGVTRDISERKSAETLLKLAYERRLRNDFFNRLLTSPASNSENMHHYFNHNNLRPPENFSLYFLDTSVFAEEEVAALKDVPPHKLKQIDVNVLIDYLNLKSNLIAWELSGIGIGIIETRITPIKKQLEIAAAQELLDYIQAYLPNPFYSLGIADYGLGWLNFSLRMDHAKTAAKVARTNCSSKLICHYDDCGIFQALAPFAASPDLEKYIENTLGPLIKYDCRQW